MEFQASVEDSPLSIMLGEAERVAVGAHAWMLQAWLTGPPQSAPSFAGTGLVQLLVCVPPLQEAEHADQPDQPPSTGGGGDVQETETKPFCPFITQPALSHP